ncbi:MAG: isocitrate/isopropylmalate dehydrogenase family protein [Roseomonas sp.]|nr:isocitrate/isopropylmalate dehydrogenase family protein [Roseomonas sp.]
MLLEWLARHQDGRENFARAGQVIESAINTLVTDPVRRTGDLGGPPGTRAFTAALGQKIDRLLGR